MLLSKAPLDLQELPYNEKLKSSVITEEFIIVKNSACAWSEIQENSCKNFI